MTSAIEEHEDPYCDELEYDGEGACVQCVMLKRELDQLRAQVAGYKCHYCQKGLPVRAFQRVGLTDGGTYCGAACWIRECTEMREFERTFDAGVTP